MTTTASRYPKDMENKERYIIFKNKDLDLKCTGIFN